MVQEKHRIRLPFGIDLDDLVRHRRDKKIEILVDPIKAYRLIKKILKPKRRRKRNGNKHRTTSAYLYHQAHDDS